MIIFKGNPLSTQLIYKYTCRGKFGQFYMTAQGKQLKEYYQLETKKQWNNKIILGNCKVEISLFFKDKRKHDVDNFSKLALDSLEGIVYENDNQIQELLVRKYYDKENPRVKIEVWEA